MTLVRALSAEVALPRFGSGGHVFVAVVTKVPHGGADEGPSEGFALRCRLRRHMRVMYSS